MSTSDQIIDVIFKHKTRADETKNDLFISNARIDTLETEVNNLKFIVNNLINLEKKSSRIIYKMCKMYEMQPCNMQWESIAPLQYKKDTK